MILPARTTRPPKAWPIAWWPRQTPMMGIRVWNVRTTSQVIPACSGEQGPGERKIASGFIASISTRVISSFRRTATSSPSWPRYWTRL